jgi:hypothetical protein
LPGSSACAFLTAAFPSKRELALRQHENLA